MPGYIAKAQTFLRALQRAPEPVRKRWQRTASAVTMALAIAGWIFYLSASFTPTAVPLDQVPEEGGFFETLGRGFGILGSAVSEEWAELKETGGSLWSELGARLANPSVFTFVREEIPFVPDSYEPVPPATLPISQ